MIELRSLSHPCALYWLHYGQRSSRHLGLALILLRGLAGILLGGYLAAKWFAENEQGQMRLTAASWLVPCFVAFLMLPGKYQALLALMPLIVQGEDAVGAVALDRQGNLAAATSTGGMTNKRYGRVGDSPVIGACIYAENDVCAISTTGWGEYFIRNVVAHDLYARIKYAGSSLNTAAKEVIDGVSCMGGYGGAIAVDARGRIAAPYSTPRMAHGYVVAGTPAVIVLNDH